MSNFKLKPTHAPVKAYYETLERFGRGKFDNEGNVRRAFEALLEKCARAYEWMVVPEYQIARAGKNPLRVDAAVLDAFNLPRGYWEAKDEKDDLKAEVNKKFAAKADKWVKPSQNCHSERSLARFCAKRSRRTCGCFCLCFLCRWLVDGEGRVDCFARAVISADGQGRSQEVLRTIPCVPVCHRRSIYPIFRQNPPLRRAREQKQPQVLRLRPTQKAAPNSAQDDRFKVGIH
jgi:hypothetical protein